MKVEIYDSAKYPLDPTQTIEDVWYVKLIHDKHTVTLRVTERDDVLELSVNGQLVIMPKAANSIAVREIGF